MLLSFFYSLSLTHKHTQISPDYTSELVRNDIFHPSMTKRSERMAKDADWLGKCYENMSGENKAEQKIKEKEEERLFFRFFLCTIPNENE